MLLAVLTLTMLSACASSNRSLSPLAVKVPSDCERLMAQIDKPAVAVGDDVRSSAARHRAALSRANQNLKQSKECSAAVRQRYSR